MCLRLHRGKKLTQETDGSFDDRWIVISIKYYQAVYMEAAGTAV